MAADAARRHATYDDVLRAPEHVVAEVLNGDLHTSPRSAGPHAEAASVLGMDLGGAFHSGRGGPGGWTSSTSPSFTSIATLSFPSWQAGSGTPSISGVSFDEAAAEAIEGNLGPIRVRFIGRAAMARNKIAAGRAKDLVDAELLQSDA